MTKIAGSGSTSQRHGPADPDPDPDPPQNVMDPQHWKKSSLQGDQKPVRIYKMRTFNLKQFFLVLQILIWA
jgi:hypothetical protein